MAAILEGDGRIAPAKWDRPSVANDKIRFNIREKAFAAKCRLSNASRELAIAERTQETKCNSGQDSEMLRSTLAIW
jgi:hypothetical protein